MSIPTPLPVQVALPPRVRAVLYYVVFILGVIVIVLTAVFGASGGVWPGWFKAFAAGAAAFGSALGLTAASNTSTAAAVPPYTGEAGGDGTYLPDEPDPEHAAG